MQEAVDNKDTEDNAKDKDEVDSILFLDDLSSYVPLARIDVSDAIYTHADLEEENLLGPLLDTRAALDNTVKKIHGLAISLPLVGESALNYV